MNILFIHEVDWLRKVVYDVHLLAEAIALRGHNVYALYYESMWQWNEQRAPREEVMSRALPEAKVQLICPSFIRLPILSRVSAFVTHYFEIKRAIVEKKIDAIVLYSVPTNGLQAIHWAKEFDVPVVFRSIDALNQLVLYPVLRTVTKMLERRVYANVDRVLTLTPKLSEYVVGLGANPSHVSVLPMTVDTNMFCPSGDDGIMRKRWGLGKNDKVVLFMGTLFNFSGLGKFIPKFKYVLNEFPEAKLLVVGDGEQRRELEGIIMAADLQKQVIITGFQPYQDMPKYINLSDVCINPFVDAEVTRDIFPGKTVQFLACGKPLVMRPLDGVRSMISGEEQGVVYADTDAKIVAEVISLLESAERRQELGQNGIKYVRGTYGCNKVAEQLEGILLELINKKEGS